MKCPKCKGNDVTISLVEAGSKTTGKTGIGVMGHAQNLARTSMALSTLGMSNLFIKKAKPKTTAKTVVKTKKVCLCQDCGHSWTIL